MQPRDPNYDGGYGGTGVSVARFSKGPQFHKKKDGVLLVEDDGSCRYLSLYERLFKWMTGRLPKRVKLF